MLHTLVDIIPQLQRDQFVSDIHRLTIHDTRTCITVSMQENWLQAVLQIAKKTSQTQPRQALIHGIYMEARMCYLPHGHSVKHLNVHYRCQPSVQHGRWWLVLPGQWTQVCRWTGCRCRHPVWLGGEAAVARGFTWEDPIIVAAQRLVSSGFRRGWGQR